MSDTKITDLIAKARLAGKLADWYMTGEGGLFRELALALEPLTAPTEPTTISIAVASRQAGKTQTMVDRILDRANERGIVVKIVESSVAPRIIQAPPLEIIQAPSIDYGSPWICTQK